MTGQQIYYWLKKFGSSAKITWIERGDRIVAPCGGTVSDWIVVAVAVMCLSGCDALIPPGPVDPIVIIEPQPQPSGRVAWLLVVEESADRTPEMAALLADPWWRASGIKFRIYDHDVPESKDIVKAIGSTKLPAIVLADQGGKVLAKSELPRTIDGVKALIARSK